MLLYAVKTLLLFFDQCFLIDLLLFTVEIFPLLLPDRYQKLSLCKEETQKLTSLSFHHMDCLKQILTAAVEYTIKIRDVSSRQSCYYGDIIFWSLQGSVCSFSLSRHM